MHYSLEAFPPKTTAHRKALQRTLSEGAFQGAEFVSVTCGAGGSGSRDTDLIVKDVQNSGLSPVPHVLCGDPREETVARIRAGASSTVLCLRGDAQSDPERGRTVLDLLADVRDETGKRALCAGYPEPHPDSRGADADLDWMRRKHDAGASGVITQYAFDADVILRYRDALHLAAPGLDLRPGVLPVRDVPGLLRFSERCGARVPAPLVEALSAYEPQSDAFYQASARMTASLLRRLSREGIASVHLYVLNEDRILKDLLHEGDLTASASKVMFAA